MMWDFSGSSGNEQAHSHYSQQPSEYPAAPGGFAMPQPGPPLPPFGAPIDLYSHNPAAHEPWLPRGPVSMRPVHGQHSSHYHQSSYQSLAASRPPPSPHYHSGHPSKPPKPHRPSPAPVAPSRLQPSSSGESHLHSFQYSKCTGRKRAVCIGINYYSTPSKQLNGCINDVQNVKRFLRVHGYQKADIMILTDDGAKGTYAPTRENIIKAMRWLVKDAHPHDSLFFHYSGHGGQTKDKNGDEIDGYDEVIYPVDFQAKGHITDDEMHHRMVEPLPVGCRLTALFDSCHSGSALDLPYLYSSRGHLKSSQVRKKWLRSKSTHADVISWAGCKDSQTSADTWKAGTATGAMSHAFIQSLQRNPNQSYRQFLLSIREILRHDYKQKPQLSSSHDIDTKLQFII